jgi:hypothetical protein
MLRNLFNQKFVILNCNASWRYIKITVKSSLRQKLANKYFANYRKQVPSRVTGFVRPAYELEWELERVSSRPHLVDCPQNKHLLFLTSSPRTSVIFMVQNLTEEWNWYLKTVFSILWLPAIIFMDLIAISFWLYVNKRRELIQRLTEEL